MVIAAKRHEVKSTKGKAAEGNVRRRPHPESSPSSRTGAGMPRSTRETLSPRDAHCRLSADGSGRDRPGSHPCPEHTTVSDAQRKAGVEHKPHSGSGCPISNTGTSSKQMRPFPNWFLKSLCQRLARCSSNPISLLPGPTGKTIFMSPFLSRPELAF